MALRRIGLFDELDMYRLNDDGARTIRGRLVDIPSERLWSG